MNKEDICKEISSIMGEHGGLWKVTESRVKALDEATKTSAGRTAAILREMVQYYQDGERFWPSKAEYYSALHDAKTSLSMSSKDMLQKLIADIESGAAADRVLHREWVIKAILQLKALRDGEKA